MNLIKHLQPEEIMNIAHSGDLGAARSLINGLKRFRDDTRKIIEDNPGHPENCLKLSQINLANKIIDLPRKALEYIEKSEGEHT